MGAMRRSVDFSQWGGELAPETIECWREQGVRHAVVQYSALMPQQLGALGASAAAAGWAVDAYVYLFWDDWDYWGSPAQRVRKALSMIAASGLPVGRLWIDAEDAADGHTRAELVSMIQMAIDACGDFPHGIYTGRWWWVPNIGYADNVFQQLPLWDAFYLGEGVPALLDREPASFDTWIPYGPWLRPLIWQWHNTTALCGHSVDLNVLEDLAEPVLEEDEMQHVTVTEEERAGAPFRSFLIGASTAGGFTSRWVQSPAEFDAAELAAGPLQEIPLEVLRTFNPSPDPQAP